MGVFGIVLLVLFSIVCALLIFMVVIQDQEGEGLGGLFSGAGNAAFGSRSSSVIVRFTYILGGLFFVIAFGLAVLNRSSVGDVEKAVRAQGDQATEWWSQEPAPETPAAETAPASN
ncbi:MAG: preprotein translocase subunit SecG [Spirochaetes bacterium]|nr:preprotein translocase subunit SecG [Spirochaetota bacterium]MBU1079293.1 preprotein translocase subunit SecG [Spirochaetota bacterium]